MSAMNLNPNDPYSLLRMGEAWRNRPGLVTLLVTFPLFVGVLALQATFATASLALAILFRLPTFATYAVDLG